MFRFKSQRRPTTAASVSHLKSENEYLRQEISRLQSRISELEGLAGEDPLVGIPNRRSFLATLGTVIGRVARYDEKAAIIFIDVDELKEINDRFGHASGDAALVRIARLISETLRKCDHVGRLGGDEFGVILEHIDELDGWNMALRIVERISASRLIVNGRSLRLSVAVGVAPIKPDDDQASVLSRADEQMYRIKRSSRMRTSADPRSKLK
jgi:diguanylate cyclase (GGDEF)-like protein